MCEVSHEWVHAWMCVDAKCQMGKLQHGMTSCVSERVVWFELLYVPLPLKMPSVSSDRSPSETKKHTSRMSAGGGTLCEQNPCLSIGCTAFGWVGRCRGINDDLKNKQYQNKRTRNKQRAERRVKCQKKNRTRKKSRECNK